MSTFSDAICKEKGDLSALLAMKNNFTEKAPPPPPPTSTVYVGPSAILGVLAGGYDVPLEKLPPLNLTTAPKTRMGRTIQRASRWLMLFAAANLAGIGISYLMGHGDKADRISASLTVASRADAAMTPERPAPAVISQKQIVKPAQNIQAHHKVAVPSAIPVASSIHKVQAVKQEPPRPQPAMQSPAKSATPPAIQVAAAKPSPVVARARLIPVAKAVKIELPDQTPIQDILSGADSKSIAESVTRQAAVVAGPKAPVHLAASEPAAKSDVEEVLYEGEPAPSGANRVDNLTGSDSAPRRDADASASQGKGRSISQAKSQSDERSGGIHVEGIFWDRKRPMALINGDIVEVGSRVGSSEVVEIQQSTVTLAENGLRRILRP